MVERTHWGWHSFLTFPAIAAVVLGLIGYGCGFYAPLVLNPSANLGPFLGISLTGPLGVGLGGAVGAVAAILRFRIATFVLTLLASGVVWSGVTLYLSLPEERWQGLIIDAEVRGCYLPSSSVPEAIARAGAIWSSPRPGWKDEVPHMLDSDRGVVLTLYVHRQREVYEQRKPWNAGQLTATRWKSIGELDRYFARFAGASCDGYPIGERRFLSPEWEASRVSPPDILPSLLGLRVAQDVPLQFRGFVGP